MDVKLNLAIVGNWKLSWLNESIFWKANICQNSKQIKLERFNSNTFVHRHILTKIVAEQVVINNKRFLLVDKDTSIKMSKTKSSMLCRSIFLMLSMMSWACLVSLETVAKDEKFSASRKDIKGKKIGFVFSKPAYRR